MKVKLTTDIPVDSKHGMTEGRILEGEYDKGDGSRGSAGVWVTGDMGERVKLFYDEYKIVLREEQ